MQPLPDPSQDAPLTHRGKQLVVLGVLLPVFLGALDGTILATALPTIGREMGHAGDLSWLITAYLLASTAVTPLYGKVSDIHGRQRTFQAGLLLYMAGSLACALAPSFGMLLFGRIVHGIGGGALTALGMVVLGDIAAPKERGRYYGYFAITYTSAGGCGPALGGFLAEHVHWSAIFWLNIPLGLLALALVTTLLKRLPRRERPHRLDWLGAVLIVVAAVAFMLALNLGGARLPWNSAPVLGLGAVAALGAAGFVARLMTAPEPFIPLTILGDPVARLAITANALGWGAVIGLNVYLPIYTQRVLGFSATEAGLYLVGLMLTVNGGAGIAGQILGRVRHYKRVPMGALTVSLCALLTLAFTAGRLGPVSFEALIILIGFGFGPLAPLTTVALQNAVLPHQLGTAIGAMAFGRSLCGTVLVAVFGAIALGVPDALLVADPQLDGAAAAAPFRTIFLVAAAGLAAALLCVLALEERPLAAEAPMGQGRLKQV